MIFLTAPLDLQQSLAYESALSLLRERHGHDQLAADRDLFDDFESYGKTWRQVYDPEKADGLYVLAREDGTIGHGVYRQWKRLSKKHDVPASLLLANGDKASELGEFTVSVIEEGGRNEQVFAVVSSDASSHGSSGSNGARKKAAGESPRKAS